MLDPAVERGRPALSGLDASPQLDLFLDDARGRPGFLEVHLCNMQERLLDRSGPRHGATRGDWPDGGRRVTGRYPWDWPRVPAYGNRADPGRESEPERAPDLLEAISREIAKALSAPCPVFREGDVLRVELLDAVAWVVDSGRQSLHLEFRDLQGAWVKARRAVDVADPLGEPFWIDQVTLRWAREIECVFAERAAEALWLLQSELARRFHAPDVLGPTSRQIRRHLDVAPAVSRAIREIDRWASESAFDGATYVALWRSEPAWAHLARHYPRLLHPVYRAWREGLVEPDTGLAAFRAACMRMGLGRAGWRFLCQHGAAAYEAVWRSSDGETTPVPELLAYVEWQARGGLSAPLARPVGACLKWTGCFRRGRAGNCRVIPDPRLARVAERLWAARGNHRTSFEDTLTDWLQVLEWFQAHRPLLDRNQWKAGWPAILRRYRRWQIRQAPAICWHGSLEPFTLDGFRVRELNCSTDLVDEGLAMRHCVADCVEECADGEYRIFSATAAESGKPIATIGMCRAGDNWEIDEVRGRYNRDPGGPVHRLAEQVLVRLTETLSSTPAGS